MAVHQDIQDAKERVRALRAQVREEQSGRSAADAEASKEVQLKALTEEERHLEQQLEAIRSVAVPGEAPDGETDVNVEGGPVHEPPPEGAPFKEVVDRYGNLIRVAVDENEGTQESEAPPPEVPDDATMTSHTQA